MKSESRNFLNGCLGLALIVAVVGGILWNARPTRKPEPPQRVLNERIDREMDALGERLNQHLDQYPRFSDSHVEADVLRFYRDDVTPLAARFAAHALQSDPQSIGASVRYELRNHWAWAWKYIGREEAGVFEAATEEEDNPPVYFIQGYANAGIPNDLEDVEKSLEHYHFAFFLSENREYWGSYSVTSWELVGGQRIVFLQRILEGRPEVVEIYDALPTYDRAVEDVKRHLNGGNRDESDAPQGDLAGGRETP